MKALVMTMNKRYPKGTKLAGGIDRKPLTPEQIKYLNRVKREELKAQKEQREWEKFGKSLAEAVKTVKKRSLAKHVANTMKNRTNKAVSQ